MMGYHVITKPNDNPGSEAMQQTQITRNNPSDIHKQTMLDGYTYENIKFPLHVEQN